MEAKGVNERDALIDLESGNNVVLSEHSHGVDANFTVGLARTAPNGGAWNGVMATGGCLKDDRYQHMDCCPLSAEAAAKNGDDRKSEGEEKLGLLDNSGGEKAKKKRSKKPPRPPRPPTTTPLDASDQKLLNELSELAALKRARIERMKALKKMKNARQGSSSSNLFPMIITIIFCLVILWQGLLDLVNLFKRVITKLCSGAGEGVSAPQWTSSWRYGRRRRLPARGMHPLPCWPVMAENGQRVRDGSWYQLELPKLVS